MPLYDYKCREHGVFHALATLEDSAEPQPCPRCGGLAARIILLPPEVLNQAKASIQASARNERSAHEPVFSTPETRQVEQERRAHGHRHTRGCGCGHESKGKSNLFYTADGKKMFPSMRPWMISH